MKRIRITIEPVRLCRSGTIYAARHEGRLLCEHVEPFCTSARILLNEGQDPSARLEMSHHGRDQVALYAPLQFAARRMVQERDDRGPEFVAYVAPRFSTLVAVKPENAPTA